jgi:nucleoid-associated protein YgaU
VSPLRFVAGRVFFRHEPLPARPKRNTIPPESRAGCPPAVLSFEAEMPVGETETRIGPLLRRGMALGILLLAMLGAAPARAQDDVAEAARQARERKTAQQNSPHHVYTDEDLKRAKILTPEDASRALTSRTVPATPEKPQVEIGKTEQKPEQIQTQPSTQEQNQETPSLGEVARKYRQEKEARHAEEAAKRNEPSRYPLELPKESLAVSKAAVVGPLSAPMGSLRGDELHLARRPAPNLPPGVGSFRMSPFTPRLAVVPVAPHATAPLATLVASLQRKQVQAGDSWWKLAHLYLGDGSRWAELLRVNPGLSQDPRRLRAGTYVFVPQNARARAAPPGTQVTVRKGDTLWSLAREQLGCGGAWPALAAANPEITNVNQLQIGAKLRIPDGTGEVCPAR